MTDQEIARDFDVLPLTDLSGYMGGSSLKHAGMEPSRYTPNHDPTRVPNASRKYPESVRKQARAMRAQGMTTKEIGWVLQIPYSSVWNFLEEGDVAARAERRQPRILRRATPEERPGRNSRTRAALIPARRSV